METHDWIICYWCPMEIDPSCHYIYMPATIFETAAQEAEQAAAELIIRLGYKDLILDEAEEILDTMEHPEQTSLSEVVSELTHQFYMECEIYRVLPGFEGSDWKANPTSFLINHCIRER